jgi:hypothetical protein
LLVTLKREFLLIIDARAVSKSQNSTQDILYSNTEVSFKFGIQIMLKFLYMKPDPFCRFIIEPRRGKNWSLDPSLVARNGIGPWVLEPSEKREISARSIRVLATCSSVQTRRPTISVCATRWRPQLLVSCLRASQSPPRGPSSSRCLLSPSSVGTTAPARPV